MTYRIILLHQNSHWNVRPAKYRHLITETTKGSNNDMTVLELALKYIATKTNVRPTTKMGYQTVVNILKQDSFGKTKIRNVRISEAKLWFIKIHLKPSFSLT